MSHSGIKGGAIKLRKRVQSFQGKGEFQSFFISNYSKVLRKKLDQPKTAFKLFSWIMIDKTLKEDTPSFFVWIKKLKKLQGCTTVCQVNRGSQINGGGGGSSSFLIINKQGVQIKIGCLFMISYQIVRSSNYFEHISVLI